MRRSWRGWTGDASAFYRQSWDDSLYVAVMACSKSWCSIKRSFRKSRHEGTVLHDVDAGLALTSKWLYTANDANLLADLVKTDRGLCAGQRNNNLQSQCNMRYMERADSSGARIYSCPSWLHACRLLLLNNRSRVREQVICAETQLQRGRILATSQQAVVEEALWAITAEDSLRKGSDVLPSLLAGCVTQLKVSGLGIAAKA